MKIRWFILIFLALFLCVILLDTVAFGGVLKRDFMLNFIYIGMDWNTAETLLGNPSGHPEVSVAIMNEYDLPFHESCRIGHHNTGSVSFIGEPGSYPLRGMILPVLFLLLAAIDVGAYFTVGYFQKKRIG